MRAIFASALMFVAAVATAQVPTANQNQREAYQQYQRGQEFLSAEQYDRAVDAFQSATKLDPNFTDAYYGLGKAYMGLQRYASAIQAYEACIDAARRLYSNREQIGRASCRERV